MRDIISFLSLLLDGYIYPLQKVNFNTTSTVLFTTLVHQLYNYPRIHIRKDIFNKKILIVKYFIIYFLTCQVRSYFLIPILPSNLNEGSIFFVGNAKVLIFRWFYYLIVGFLKNVINLADYTLLRKKNGQ